MMVTFVSECEKKALNRTRRVLDAFANRIGSRTWQTVITNEGLQAVKKLLRKTATKNTAVSCHWIRSRSRSELVWVVGNKSRFNYEGIVPVNSTQKPIKLIEEKDWPYMAFLRSLIAIAALFHDWGKATDLFQGKLINKKSRLNGDPLRHEWISCILFSAFVSGKTDKEWLSQLAEQQINEEKILETILSEEKRKKPFEDLDPFASMAMWLILTHHRLPFLLKNKTRPNYRNTDINLKATDWYGEPAFDITELFECIQQEWGYENYSEKEHKEFETRLQKCFQFAKSSPLMLNSKPWTEELRKWAKKTLDRGCLDLIASIQNNGVWRLILYHARLSLMLGDHFYSSLPADTKWSNTSKVKLIANTYDKDYFDKKSKALIGKKGKPKQKLDEHLFYVAKHAQQVPRIMKLAESSLIRADDTDALTKPSSDESFKWQDDAVKKIKQWRKNNQIEDPNHFGFFTVNIASTGKGKTFANAKIMRELSPDAQSLRYILALGLRSLTLQTGSEYKTRIFNEKEGMDLSSHQDFAVLIGSQAILDLYNDSKSTMVDEESFEVAGSESQEDLYAGEIDSFIDDSVFSEEIKAIIKNKKHLQMLYAPVLVCTIDHIMAASETKRGGRYILPYLRLMSSDLVIDEIDDFTGSDLIAIGRLIYLVGMLGRKVMISSATIPPDLAEGYFHLYQQGWRLFSQSRNLPATVICAWVDEFCTRIKEVKQTEKAATDYFQTEHKDFIKNRIAELKKESVKRKAEIIPIHKSEENEETIRNNYFSVILDALLNKHKDHHELDPITNKAVSIGIVRMANIKPCVQLAQFLMTCDIQNEADTEIRVMAYHSQQILLMRHAQEEYLDKVLSRKKKEPDSPDTIFQDELIREHLNQTNAKNLIYVLVATPVEEVGRDHDFDWAIVEPSSFRSIIQLAGRILRHRDKSINQPNMGLLQYNLKSLIQSDDKPAFCHPGPESKANKLENHDLEQLISNVAVEERIDATPRISKNSPLSPKGNLIDLEHECIAQLLTDYEGKGVQAMESWIRECWWCSALPQVVNSFRQAEKQLLLFRVPQEDDDTKFVFKEKTPKGELTGLSVFIEDQGKSRNSNPRLWLERNYQDLLTQLAEKKEISLEKAGMIYGELALSIYDEKMSKYNYSPDTGLVKQ